MRASNLEDWTGLSDGPLPVDAAVAWVRASGCRAVVCCCETTQGRSAQGRPTVTTWDLRAHRRLAASRLAAIAGATRAQWPSLGCIVVLHRIGVVAEDDVRAVVVVGASDRTEAFEAARFAVDTLEHTTPIWRFEVETAGAEATGPRRSRETAGAVSRSPAREPAATRSGVVVGTDQALPSHGGGHDRLPSAS